MSASNTQSTHQRSNQTHSNRPWRLDQLLGRGEGHTFVLIPRVRIPSSTKQIRYRFVRGHVAKTVHAHTETPLSLVARVLMRQLRRGRQTSG